MKQIYLLACLSIGFFSNAQCFTYQSKAFYDNNGWNSVTNVLSCQGFQVTSPIPQDSSTDKILAIDCDGVVSASTQTIDQMFNARVPVARTVTINGVTQDLSANRSWTVTGAGSIISAPTAISAGARTINTGYRVSTTKESEISVNATANVSIGVLGNVTATVFIEVSPDNATWTRVGQATKNSGSLVGLNTGNGGCFRYRLPVGYYWRWVTVTSATGIGNTATFSYDGGSEQVYN